jgi:hypothetical protein
MTIPFNMVTRLNDLANSTMRFLKKKNNIAITIIIPTPKVYAVDFPSKKFVKGNLMLTIKIGMIREKVT